MEHSAVKCENCNAEDYILLVNYGSFYFQCPNCKNHGPATSFIAIKKSLLGEFEIIEVDKNLDPVITIGKGQIFDYEERISCEAQNGKIIWLKKIE